VYAACDFAALLYEPGSVGDRWQVLSSRDDRPDRKLPMAIRDHGGLEVADLEAIKAIAV
jgi:hypothetical protein